MIRVVTERRFGVSKGSVFETEDPRRVPDKGEEYRVLSPEGRVEYLKAANVIYPSGFRGSPYIDIVTIQPAKAKGPIERSFHWMLGGAFVLMMPLVWMTMQVTPVGGQPAMEDLVALQPNIEPFAFAMVGWIIACVTLGTVCEARNAEALRREQLRVGL